MALDPITSNTVLSIINRKWKNKNCLLCGANAWAINGYVTLTMSNVPTEQVIGGGVVLPSAAVICRNCGNTHIINLVIAGLVPGL